MRENKILSSAALITKIFIFFIIFLNVKAEVVNKKYFKNEQGVLAIMYHRFEENKYPSTNIRMNIFLEHIAAIKNNGFEFYNVVEYNNTDPAILKYELPETATNPGVADLVQKFATIIKFSQYPKFNTTQRSSEFRTGEKISVRKTRVSS